VDQAGTPFAKGDEPVFPGPEKVGLLSVEGNDGAGWVDQALVKKH